MVSLKEWARVQTIERAYHEEKDAAQVMGVNRVYWQRILDSLPKSSVALGPQTRVLDVGCGGAGIVLAVAQGIRTGVDPLMGFYLEKFPFLKDEPVRWLAGTAEDFGPEETFDVVFSINMLDHTFDPRASAANLERLLAPGGRLVLVLNVHLTRFWRAYYSSFYRFVDPPHPHHLHIEDVPGYFPGLVLLHRYDIDGLWLDLKDAYDAKVLRKKRFDAARTARNALNLFKYPILAARLAGRPFHRRSVRETPIMASTLFVLGKPGAGAA